MSLHVGPPQNPGVMKFHTDSIKGTVSGRSWKQDRFVIHAIKSLLGISWGSRWYFGLIRFSETKTEVKNERSPETY